jgi:aerobic carbon-monoxide dehydrogenase medium subunit
LANRGLAAGPHRPLVGVAERVVRARHSEVLLEAEKPDGELLAEAAAAVDQAISAPSDLNGSAAYRRHVAKVLTKRAILTAWRRAEGRRCRVGGR